MPLREFWGKRANGTLPAAMGIYRCAKGACTANATTNKPKCTTGRAGVLCGVCSDGYYSTNSLECKKCPTTDASSVVQYTMAMFLLLALWRLARSFKTRVEKHRPRSGFLTATANSSGESGGEPPSTAPARPRKMTFRTKNQKRSDRQIPSGQQTILSVGRAASQVADARAPAASGAYKSQGTA